MNKKIENRSQLNPLREVWIGGVYPENFYSHYDHRTQDIFGKLTETTIEDFNNLEKIISNLGVSVIRPKFQNNVSLYMDEHDNLIKPPVSPCDWAITVDDTLYISPQYQSGIEPYQHAIDEYIAHGQKVKILDRSLPEPMAWVTFPSVIRLGRDILIDYDPNIPESKKYSMIVAEELAKSHRVHLSNTADHNDGVFCPLKPREIFSTHYRSTYNTSFPNWNVFWLPEPKFNGHALNWWVPGKNYAHFNNEVVNVASSWLGNPHETVFEVNMLVIDEHNVVCAGQDDNAFRHFEKLGITPHVVDFKTCYFWDAGIHCVSSDVYREGPMPDYWPTRGANGIYHITDWDNT
jgi:hypothetical protein